MLVCNLFCMSIFSVVALPSIPMNLTNILTKQDMAEAVWSVTIQCNNSDGLYDYVTFGEAADANDGSPIDTYDTPKPPAPIAPYIYAKFNDNLPSPYDALFSASFDLGRKKANEDIIKFLQK